MKFTYLLAAAVYVSCSITTYAHEGENKSVVGDEMSDAVTTASIPKTKDNSCQAEAPTAMSPARKFDILSSIGPKTTSASEATP
jgi:hypothetical protein